MKGKQEIRLTRGQNKLQIAAPTPILLSLNDAPLRVVQGNATWIGTIEEDSLLSIDPSDNKAEYHVDIDHYNGSRFEKRDDIPPPPPPAPDNYLQMLAIKVRQQMGIMRENFAERTSIYEMGDIDDWEEDQLTRSKDEKNERLHEKESTTPEDVAGEQQSQGAEESDVSDEK